MEQQIQIKKEKVVKQCFDYNLLIETRKNFEIKTMFQLGRPLVAKIKQKSFPKPSPKFLSSRKKAEDEDSDSLSTAESSGEEEQDIALSYDRLIREEIAKNELKITSLLKLFSEFEERVATILPQEKIEVHRSDLFRILGKVLEEQTLYQKFNVSQLGMCMLYLSVRRVGLKSNIFMVILAKIFKSPYKRTSQLKKSGCFLAIKNLFFSY